MSKKRTPMEQQGFEWMKGAVSYLCDLLLVTFLLVCAFFLLYYHFDGGLDDSDKDGWNRSNMSVHTDYRTKIQYLSTKSGLTPRLDREGNFVLSE